MYLLYKHVYIYIYVYIYTNGWMSTNLSVEHEHVRAHKHDLSDGAERHLFAALSAPLPTLLVFAIIYTYIQMNILYIYVYIYIYINIYTNGWMSTSLSVEHEHVRAHKHVLSDGAERHLFGALSAPLPSLLVFAIIFVFEVHVRVRQACW